MGMHLGFIVARTEWSRLRAAVEARCGALNDADEISPEQWFDFPAGEDAFDVASVDGTTYVLDRSMVLSAETVAPFRHPAHCTHRSIDTPSSTRAPTRTTGLKNITVQARGSGGFDITARPSARPRGSRLRRLFPRGR